MGLSNLRHSILFVLSKCKDLTKIININSLDHRVFLKVLENKYLEIYKFEGLA